MTDSASERLTAAAMRLFQERGLSRVGINEIVRDAEVARMSLYNNFRSKDDLALAAYAALSETRQEAVDAAIAASPDARTGILAIFDLARELAVAPAFRGCAFLDLAAHSGPEDAPLIALVRHHKSALRDRFTQLALESGVHDADLLGRQLLALWDGALSDAFIEGDVTPIAAARAAAARLLGPSA